MIAQSDITMEINPLEKSGRNQRQIRETGGRQWWVSANWRRSVVGLAAEGHLKQLIEFGSKFKSFTPVTEKARELFVCRVFKPQHSLVEKSINLWRGENEKRDRSIDTTWNLQAEFWNGFYTQYGHNILISGNLNLELNHTLPNYHIGSPLSPVNELVHMTWLSIWTLQKSWKHNYNCRSHNFTNSKRPEARITFATAPNQDDYIRNSNYCR